MGHIGRERVLRRAIEAEARAEGHITALRSALQAVWEYASDNWPSDTFDLSEQFDVLSDTASAATEEVERIEKPWREVFRPIAEQWHNHRHGYMGTVTFEACENAQCKAARALLTGGRK